MKEHQKTCEGIWSRLTNFLEGNPTHDRIAQIMVITGVLVGIFFNKVLEEMLTTNNEKYFARRY